MFTKTSTAIAGAAEALPETVRDYARRGLLEHVIASDGRFLFKADAAERVRELKAEGLARRGRR